jgi:hypothetical protein
MRAQHPCCWLGATATFRKDWCTQQSAQRNLQWLEGLAGNLTVMSSCSKGVLLNRARLATERILQE